MVWVEYIWWVDVVVLLSSLPPLPVFVGCRIVLIGGRLVWFGVIILYSSHNYLEYFDGYRVSMLVGIV